MTACVLQRSGKKGESLKERLEKSQLPTKTGEKPEIGSHTEDKVKQ